MEKKERKVEEIQGLLEDIIEPKLSTLRLERNDFVEFKRTEAEMEQVQKDTWLPLTTLQLRNTVRKSRQNCCKSLNTWPRCAKSMTANKVEWQELNTKLEALIRKRQKEAHNSVVLKQLESQSKEATMSAVRIETELNLQRKRFEEEQTKAVQIKETIKTQKKTTTEQAEHVLISKQHYESAKSIYDQLQGKTIQEEELLQSLTTGVSTTGSDSGYARLLNGKTLYLIYPLDLRQQKSAASSTVQKAQIQLAELASELNSLEPRAAEARKRLNGKMETISELRAGIAELEAKLADSGYDTSAESVLTQEKRQLDTKMRKLEEAVDELKAQVNQCNLNFNMNGVKGVVASLIDIPREHSKYINALEVAAGGRLYNVTRMSFSYYRLLLRTKRLQTFCSKVES